MFQLFRCLQNLQFFSFWWIMQRSAKSRSPVRLLFGIVAGPLIALQWSVGFCEQPQVNFLSRIVDDHISLPAYDFLLDALSDIFDVEQFLNLIY